MRRPHPLIYHENLEFVRKSKARPHWIKRLHQRRCSLGNNNTFISKVVQINLQR